jgi:ATP synthase protein I
LSDTDPDALDRRIAEAKAASERPMAQPQAEGRGWAIGVEFVGTVLVTTFIGYLIDRAAGSSPWALIVFLMLGFAAGTWRAAKTSKQFDSDPRD